MDINQIARMIEWLDEERRRDKQLIATLEERLTQQTETMTTLQRRLNSVESDQTTFRESAIPIERERDMAEQLRQEMRQVVESGEARRLAAERENERRQEVNREGLLRTIRDLGEKLERLQKNVGTVSEVKTEGTRLFDTVITLQQRVDDIIKKLEEPDRRLSFLEEQRRQDARRISELETELPELKKQLDSLRPKVTLIEDLAIRNERRVQEVLNGDRERREQIQQLIDQQSLITQQSAHRIEELTKQFSEHEDIMQKNAERFETWASAYRDMKRIIDDFERIGDRLERRINEVAEMQRLSEERFRQEWNTWREDDQKRWKQLTLSSDEVWRNHDKEFDGFVSRLDGIETAIPPLRESLQRMWNLERERAQMYRERYQAMMTNYDNPEDNNPNGQRPSNNGSNGSYRNGNNGF